MLQLFLVSGANSNPTILSRRVLAFLLRSRLLLLLRLAPRIEQLGVDDLHDGLRLLCYKLKILGLAVEGAEDVSEEGRRFEGARVRVDEANVLELDSLVAGLLQGLFLFVFFSLCRLAAALGCITRQRGGALSGIRL